MKATQKILQDITTCIGHLQQNRSPQPISPTNTVDPANQGNNNTQRGRGFYRGGGIETEVEVRTFIKIDLPYVGGARAM